MTIAAGEASKSFAGLEQVVDALLAARMERRGVFVRRAAFWPRLRRVRQVIFDKTGTLTLENPVLENPEALRALRPEALRALYTRRNEGVSIWVVPADAISSSDPDSKGSFFESPQGKDYRHATYYTKSEGVKHL